VLRHLAEVSQEIQHRGNPTHVRGVPSEARTHPTFILGYEDERRYYIGMIRTEQ
jgi:hypothetical protein